MCDRISSEVSEYVSRESDSSSSDCLLSSYSGTSSTKSYYPSSYFISLLSLWTSDSYSISEKSMLKELDFPLGLRSSTKRVTVPFIVIY